MVVKDPNARYSGGEVMAEVSFLYRRNPVAVGSVIVDACLSEQHTLASDVTQFPRERGKDVGDHVRPKRAVVQLECIVSNAPIDVTQRERVSDASGVTFNSTAVDDTSGVAGYAQSAYQELKRLRLSKTTLTVVTSLETYEDMVIENLSIPVSSRTGDALVFTVNLVELETVDLKTTTLTVETRAKPKLKAGPQTPKPTGEQMKKKSIVAAGADYFFNLVGGQ